MANDYTPISLIRGNSTVIDETSIVDGQILFDESRKCLFMDDGDTRSKYSGLGADSNVATVEDTTTSTHAYAKGDYVVVEGQLYEVIAAIAIGDTFTVGTNITQTTVGDELVQIKSDLDKLTLITGFNYQKLKETDITPFNYKKLQFTLGYGDYRVYVYLDPRGLDSLIGSKHSIICLKYYSSGFHEIMADVVITSTQIYVNQILVDQSAVTTSDSNWIVWLHAK